jgi:chromosome segregation protein
VKLAYLDLCGFRGYRAPIRIDFAEVFTVIDGRNGVGKSTICDAVEFVLTGTIGKYLDAKADGETIADYIWWTGDGPSPEQYYVEVGFRDGDAVLPVRREQLAAFNKNQLAAVADRLCDSALGPKNALSQLCNASIIRDEHIAALSLDLTESQRYALLCEAIGGTDADRWIDRGKAVLTHAKKRREAVENEVAEAARDAATAARRMDELRVAITEEASLSAAVARLQTFAGSAATADKIVEVVRPALAERTRQLEELTRLAGGWSQTQTAQDALPGMRSAVEEADRAVVQAATDLADVADANETKEDSLTTSQRARDLVALASLGRRLGLRDAHCPLCAALQDHNTYQRGIAAAEHEAELLDAKAAERARREQLRQIADSRRGAVRAAAETRRGELAQTEAQVLDFARRLAALGLELRGGRLALDRRIEELTIEVGRAREDLRIVETLKMNTALERAIGVEQSAKQVHAKAEERLGIARRVERQAEALHDAARRAEGETLRQRLDRVLPLMAELFRRLRPHPVWSDIDYKIRGDVRRFLKLLVGDELNPQFIFSSGQRRATGLAFLLSVNLSLAWSHWNTILLDDPVQHVDDFRSVHLAEVMAQLAIAGRQIVCVVEDPALADLLCRRLPITGPNQGKRITLGPNLDGTLSKLEEVNLAPLQPAVLVSQMDRIAG